MNRLKSWLTSAVEARVVPAAVADPQEHATMLFHQKSDTSQGAPQLPPDVMLLQHGQPLQTIDGDVAARREIYNNKLGESLKRRKFVDGYLYKDVSLARKITQDDLVDGRLQLVVTLADGSTSTIHIVDANRFAGDIAMSAIKDVGEKIPCFNARKRSCDIGGMAGVGNRSDFGKVRRTSCTASLTPCNVLTAMPAYFFFSFVLQKVQFANMKDKVFAPAVRAACIAFADLTRRVLPNVAEAIHKAVDGSIPDNMGGDRGLSDTGDISEDLGNSSHYDLDASISVTMFCERIAGRAKNWHMVWPLLGDKGVVLQLWDGCILSWDGRAIRHVSLLSFNIIITTVTDILVSNSVPVLPTLA
jgi:hypothetical protein